MKPALCRWRAWRSPGLPSPTNSFIGPAAPARLSWPPASRPWPPAASVTTVGGTIEQMVKSRSVIVGPHARRQRDVADVDRIADLAAGEVDHDLARDRVGRADQLQGPADDVEHAAALEARRLVLVDEAHRHVDVDHRPLLGAQEVDVQRVVGDRVQLRLARQHLEALVAEVELEHRAEEARVLGQLEPDLLERHGDAQRLLAAAIDDRRDLAARAAAAAPGPCPTSRAARPGKPWSSRFPFAPPARRPVGTPDRPLTEPLSRTGWRPSSRSRSG